MARPDYPLAAAIRTVRDGLSARAGLRAFRSGGGAVNDTKWFRTVAEVRRVVAERIDEASRPLNRRPTGDEITRLTSRKAVGYWQEIEVFTRDRSTGEVAASTFVLRGQGLVTRQAAIDFAVAEYAAGSAGSLNEAEDEVLGAAYVSTLELFPDAEE